jgi:hypothetical protein
MRAAEIARLAQAEREHAERERERERLKAEDEEERRVAKEMVRSGRTGSGEGDRDEGGWGVRDDGFDV